MSETRGIFLHDPVQGTTWEKDVMARGFGRQASFCPLLKTAHSATIYISVLQAFAGNRELMLLDPDFTREEAAAQVRDLSLGNLEERFVLNPEIESIEGLRRIVGPSSEGRLSLLTSGTTGIPKKVTHSYQSLARGVRFSQEHRNAVWGLAYNPAHMAGIQVFLQAFLNGNPLIQLFGHDRDTVFQLIREFRITHLSATPSFYRMLLPSTEPLESVRHLTFGGERFDPSLEESIARLFPHARLHNIYATTESGPLFASTGDVFTVGGPDADLVKVENNQLFLHRNLLGKFSHEGDWYATGDVVETLSTNPLQFRFLARSMEVVNVGGYQVSLTEVEEALRSHPGVADARVFPQKNSLLGNLLAAEIRPAGDPPSNRQLRLHLESRLQPHKIPRIVHFVPELKMTRSGKVLR